MIMVNQEEILDFLSSKKAATFKDMANGLGLPWNETVRKSLNIKVISLERYGFVTKDRVDNRVLIHINDKCK